MTRVATRQVYSLGTRVLRSNKADTKEIIMKKVEITDIISGSALPEQLKIVVWRCKKTKQQQLANIELFRGQACMVRNVVLQCNLQSYHAKQNNLCPMLIKAKQEAKTRWPHVIATDLKIGKIYVANKSNPAGYKKLCLDQSYFLFNMPDQEMIIYLWGKRFEPNLRFMKNYFGSGYMSFQSGREQVSKPMTAGERLIIETVKNKFRHRGQESVFAAIELYTGSHGITHKLSVDDFMELLASCWDFPIVFEGEQHDFSSLAEDIRTLVVQRLEIARNIE